MALPLPDSTTIIGSALAAPDLLNQINGEYHPLWTVLTVSIIVAPKIVTPVVNALRDIAVAHIGRGDGPVGPPDDTP